MVSGRKVVDRSYTRTWKLCLAGFTPTNRNFYDVVSINKSTTPQRTLWRSYWNMQRWWAIGSTSMSHWSDWSVRLLPIVGNIKRQRQIVVYSWHTSCGGARSCVASPFIWWIISGHIIVGCNTGRAHASHCSFTYNCSHFSTIYLLPVLRCTQERSGFPWAWYFDDITRNKWERKQR